MRWIGQKEKKPLAAPGPPAGSVRRRKGEAS